MRLKFNRSLSLFFCFFNFKLFLLNWLWFGLSLRLLTLFFFIFFLFFLCLFLFRNLSLLDPFLNKITFFKSDQSIFIEFDFKTNSKGLMLRILCWCFIISDMFIESVNTWLILNQNFNWLSSFEFDCFTWRNFGTKIMDHLTLSFWIFGWIKA